MLRDEILPGIHRGATMRIVAIITDRSVITKILTHLPPAATATGGSGPGPPRHPPPGPAPDPSVN